MIIPKGSIIALPKGNVEYFPLISKIDIKINSKDVEIYDSWKDYIRVLKSKQERK